MAQRLHILDGHGYIFRAHYGLATGGPNRQGVRLTTANGMPTGALYVYTSMLIRLHLDVHPERIAVVFDSGKPSFRSEVDPQYKANRSEAPEDLVVQMPRFRPLTEAFSWPCVTVEGVEADDVIATLVAQARHRDWDVTIYSADKDLMQLVDDHVVMIDSMRQITYDTAGVKKKMGVAPELVGDFLALVGDSSDNIPGVAGVGKVTATKLLDQYGSIDNMLQHTGELKGKLRERLSDPEQLEVLERSRKLVTLKSDVDLPCQLDELVPGNWDSARLEGMLRELEFQALIDRLGQKGVGSEPAVVEPAPVEQPIDVTIVTTGEQLDQLMAALAASDRASLWIERDGQREDRSRPVGIAVAVPDAQAFYIPLEHRYLGVPDQLRPDSLGPLVEALSATQLSCHDARVGYKVLAQAGLELTCTAADTLLGAYLLDASTDRYDIDRVADEFGKMRVPPRKQLLGSGKGATPFESLGVEQAADYAGRAAVGVLRAANAVGQRLDHAGMGGLYRDVELPIARLLATMERRGIALDTEHLAVLSDRIQGQIAEIERTIYDHAGEPINVGSPKQLAHLLFDKLGLKSERMKKTKTGFSTDHEVLDGMRDTHPIVPLILEHRELVKLKGTYIDALPPLVNPDTCRLHTSYRQAVAATGRLSSTDPNLQNIPIRSELGIEIRRAFVAPPGRVLVAADYSQIELRVLAHLSGDPVLCKAFAEGIDVHTQTAAEVFGIGLDEVGAHERRVAKAVNYGLVYGQSEFGLSRALDIPRSEARHYIERYFERFNTVRAFMDEIVERARQAGYATTILGRRRPIPGLTARNYQVRTGAERIAQNTPMQGSGADIMKLAMLRVDSMLSAGGYGADMLLTVHDELVVEVDEDQAEKVAAAMVAEMEAAYQLDVPLVVDSGWGHTWADAH